MKTRIQMDQTKLTETVKKIFVKEGPLGFYKGIGGPILAIPFLSSIVFATYQISGRCMQNYLGETGSFSLLVSGFAGAIAGIVNSPIVCAAELVKCKLQMQKSGPKIYKNTIDCGTQLVRKNG